ncbi:MAG TPA: Hsp20/alpha crystallin family protein [Streptosporangiaceae bacterium]|nr:Hsp20/alpha crystallin family protein [Streptosporangiaceae bacterium]
MLLTSFDPISAEFDRLVQRAFGPVGAARPVMRMDGIRREDAVELRFDLPGIDTDSIDVTVDRGLLTVSAHRGEEYAEGEKPFIRERVMGSFTRQVRLSEAVDSEKIEAGYDRGILTVRLPLAEKALPRKVEVRTEAKAEIAA